VDSTLYAPGYRAGDRRQPGMNRGGGMRVQQQWLFEAPIAEWEQGLELNVGQAVSRPDIQIVSDSEVARPRPLAGLTIRLAFDAQGFGVTGEFLNAWFKLSAAGRVGTSGAFGKAFCEANHFEFDWKSKQSGNTIRFNAADVWGYTIVYSYRRGQKPLLQGIQKKGWYLQFVGRSIPRPPFSFCEMRRPAAPTRTLGIIDPQPSDYADMARKILRKRKQSVGIVLSVVQLISVDGKVLIDTRTEGTMRPRLKNPPRHVVMPAEVYEITWKRKKLRYVWIMSNPKSTFPVGGVLFLPPEHSAVFYMVTFNTGALDDGVCTNVHHAEMQAVSWIEAQPRPWQARIGAIAIWNLSRKTGLGYSPCNACCVDLAQFLTNLQAQRSATPVRASITWLTLYNKNKACGHPTDSANLRRLHASGWKPNGPGWSPAQQLPSTNASRVWKA
jgi:hypothetical protein